MDTLELPTVAPTEPLSRQNPDLDTADRRRRYRWAPQDRPPAVGRAFFGLLGFATALTTAALLLSDRAPGILRTVFGDHARRLWARIDAEGRVDTAPGSTVAELTQPDFLVHVALWATVAVLAGLAIWTWRGLMLTAIALAFASVILEVAQGRLATTRSVEASDAAANLVGIAIGAGAAGACYLAWSAGAVAVRRLRSNAV